MYKRKKLQINKVAKPYILMNSDPHKKSTKVLTSPKKKARLDKVNKETRVVSNKQKLLQNICIGILAVCAVVGLAQLLGGEIRHVVVAAFISAWLYAQSMGWF